MPSSSDKATDVEERDYSEQVFKVKTAIREWPGVERLYLCALMDAIGVDLNHSGLGNGWAFIESFDMVSTDISLEGDLQDSLAEPLDDADYDLNSLPPSGEFLARANQVLEMYLGIRLSEGTESAAKDPEYQYPGALWWEIIAS